MACVSITTRWDVGLRSKVTKTSPNAFPLLATSDRPHALFLMLVPTYNSTTTLSQEQHDSGIM